MNATSVVIAQDGAAGAPMSPQAKAWTLFGVFWVGIGGVVLLLALSVGVIVLKRKRRLAALKADTARRQALDPWSEAGRRAQTPEAEDLEPE